MTQLGVTTEQDRREAEAKEEKAARLRYVNELKGADDRWVTVKVAARITGVSEAMANRWVTSGRIPMKGNPLAREADLVGQEGRTRQVRLNDVREIRPILYPALATETAVNTLNIKDIPKEMARVSAEAAQIAEDHQTLMGKYDELLAVMAQWEASLREQGETFAGQVLVQGEAFAGQAHELQEEYRRLLQQQQEIQAKQLSLVEARIEKELQIQSQACDQLWQTWREMESARREEMQRVSNQQEKLTNAQGELFGKLEAYHEQGQLFAQQQQQSWAAFQRQVNAGLARSEAAFRENIGTTENRLRADKTRLEETLLQQLSSVRQDIDAEIAGLRQQVGSLEQQLKQAEERAARWEQVATEKVALADQMVQIVAALTARGILPLSSSEKKKPTN